MAWSAIVAALVLVAELVLVADCHCSGQGAPQRNASVLVVLVVVAAPAVAVVVVARVLADNEDTAKIYKLGRGATTTNIILQIDVPWRYT